MRGLFLRDWAFRKITMHVCKIIGGSITLEQSNQRVTSRASVEPECNRIVGRVTPGLEEPEESVHVRSKVDVSRVRVNTGCGLANTLLAWLLVTDGDI